MCYQVKERTRNSIANVQREKLQKYPKRNYGSSARQIATLCCRGVWSFNQRALTVLNLQSGQNLHLVMLYPYSTQAPNPTNCHKLTNIWIRV